MVLQNPVARQPYEMPTPWTALLPEFASGTLMANLPPLIFEQVRDVEQPFIDGLWADCHVRLLAWLR